MSLNRLFETPYQLYESMKHMKLTDIKNLCRSNKEIAYFCRNNTLVQKLILEKHSEAIEDRIDQYIARKGEKGQSEEDINFAFAWANGEGDVEVIKRLLNKSSGTSGDSSNDYQI